MKIYEFFDEDYNEVLGLAEDINELTTHLIKCLDKAKGLKNGQDGEINFRRSPRMRGSMSSQGSTRPQMRSHIEGYHSLPHMRGYVVRPEDEDWAYSERYNW